MIARDKQIIETVEHFRCLSRDQIARLYFDHCKRPEINANNALKRLRDRKYLTIAPYRQPYVYLANPSPIKRDSNKIDHYLAIADVYTALKQSGRLRTFDVEPRYGAEARPDVFAIYRGTPFFIEVQNSVYSEKIMRDKIKRYQSFYEDKSWQTFEWQRKDRPVFPYILILSKKRYHVDFTHGMQVVQFRDVDEFLRSISK